MKIVSENYIQKQSKKLIDMIKNDGYWNIDNGKNNFKEIEVELAKQNIGVYIGFDLVNRISISIYTPNNIELFYNKQVKIITHEIF